MYARVVGVFRSLTSEKQIKPTYQQVFKRFSGLWKFRILPNLRQSCKRAFFYSSKFQATLVYTLSYYIYELVNVSFHVQHCMNMNSGLLFRHYFNGLFFRSKFNQSYNTMRCMFKQIHCDFLHGSLKLSLFLFQHTSHRAT